MSTKIQRKIINAPVLKQKRKIDASDEKQKENWSLEDIYAKLVDAAESVECRTASHEKWSNVVAIMLASNTPQNFLLHYMHKAAMEVEIELRNRTSAQLGSLHIDVTVPVELEAEVERRIGVYIQKCDVLTMLRDDDPTKEEHKLFCEEMFRVLNVYQAMSESLSCRGTPQYTNMIDATQALFFCIVHMSRELQAMLFQQRHRWRLPQHCAMRQPCVLDFMNVLRKLTPLYTSHVLSSAEYVDKLRKYVYWGSLEVDDLEWIETSASVATSAHTNVDDDGEDDDEDDDGVLEQHSSERTSTENTPPHEMKTD
jgi:hypothetical protein